jgi:pimeloyl-ACP methyl ester carboxylesterase
MYNFLHIHNRQEFLNHFVPSEREVVIMIRGLSRSYRSWLGFHHELSEHFDVICLDLPGVGLSKDEKPLFRVQAMAQKLAEVIHHLRLPRCYLMAPSLGAMVAMEMTRYLPVEVVRGLIIMSPSHSGVGLSRLTREALKAFQQALKAPPAEVVKLAQEILIGRLENGQRLEDVNPDRLLDWCQSMTRDNQELGRKGQAAQIAAALGYSSRLAMGHVRTFQIPLKCLIPTDDHLIPVAHSRLVYEALKHPQSAVIELHNAGHDLIVTHERQVRDIVTEFVKEQSTYRVYPADLVARQRTQQLELQNRLYTSLGLISIGLFIFSWLFRDRNPRV